MSLGRAKVLVLELIDRHDLADGVGDDPCCSVPQQHAMAEGKFLSTIATLVQARLISGTRFEALAKKSLARLLSVSMPSESGTGFGLGFSWGKESEESAFAVTTSIVTDGLLAAAALSASPAFAEMAEETRRWLLSDDINESTVDGRLPCYSVSDRSIVTNVVGLWATVLGDDQDHMAAMGREYILRAHIEGVGWTYSHESTRVDLLHTCYSVRPFLDYPDMGLEIATAVSRFVSSNGFIDKFDVMSVDDAVDVASRSSRSVVQIEGERGFVVFGEPARVWSLGELLVVAAARPGGQRLEGFWRSLAARALNHVFEIDLRSEGPRHAMHLAHGLASILARARAGAR